MDEATNVVLLELKYCEKCGGLWVRPRGIQTVECYVCSAQQGDFIFRRKNAVTVRSLMKRHSSNLATFCREGGPA